MVVFVAVVVVAENFQGPDYMLQIDHHNVDYTRHAVAVAVAVAAAAAIGCIGYSPAAHTEDNQNTLVVAHIRVVDCSLCTVRTVGTAAQVEMTLRLVGRNWLLV